MALDTIDLIEAVPGNADRHQHEKPDGSREFAGAVVMTEMCNSWPVRAGRGGL